MTATATTVERTAEPLVNPRRYVDPNAYVLAQDLTRQDIVNTGTAWREVLDVAESIEDMRGVVSEEQQAELEEGDGNATALLGVSRNYQPGTLLAVEDNDSGTAAARAHLTGDFRRIGALLASSEYVAARVVLPNLIVDGVTFASAWVLWPKTWPVQVVRRFA